MSETQKVTALSAALVRQQHTDAYRSQCGIGKPVSRGALIDASGIPDNTLDGYGKGTGAPDLLNFLRIAQVLGPDYVNRVLALIGLGGVRPLAPAEAGVLDVNAAATRLVAKIASDLNDPVTPGRIDHREFAEELPLMRDLHRVLGGILETAAAGAVPFRAVGGGR